MYPEWHTTGKLYKAVKKLSPKKTRGDVTV